MRTEGAAPRGGTRGRGCINSRSSHSVPACRGCGYHVVTDRFRGLCVTCGFYAQLRIVIGHHLALMRGRA